MSHILQNRTTVNCWRVDGLFCTEPAFLRAPTIETLDYLSPSTNTSRIAFALVLQVGRRRSATQPTIALVAQSQVARL
jgi:hypothetical protein